MTESDFQILHRDSKPSEIRRKHENISLSILKILELGRHFSDVLARFCAFSIYDTTK